MLEPLLLAFPTSCTPASSAMWRGAPASRTPRDRKLPLPTLLDVMLSGMRKGVQAELDEFFAHIEQRAQLERHVSERAFFSARAKLDASAIPALNTWLVRKPASLGYCRRHAMPRRTNPSCQSYAHTVLKPFLPSLLLRFTAAIELLHAAIVLIDRKTYFNKRGLSKPRKKQAKPHKPMMQKQCQCGNSNNAMSDGLARQRPRDHIAMGAQSH